MLYEYEWRRKLPTFVLLLLVILLEFLFYICCKIVVLYRCVTITRACPLLR